MKFGVIALALCLWGKLLASENLHYDGRPLFVSLGSDSEAAAYLRESQLNTASLPFDTLVALNHERFIALLDQDFQFFLTDEYLKWHPQMPHVLQNTYYQVEFLHDWPFADQAVSSFRYSLHLQEIRAKYKRKIVRFRQIAHYPNTVYFIWSANDLSQREEGVQGLNSAQANALKQALNRFFPSLDFTLVIINYLGTDRIDGVLEFKVRKSHKQEDWRALLKILQELDQLEQSLTQDAEN